MRRSVSLIAAAAAILPALWIQAWPVGSTACKDSTYRFQVAMETVANRQAADFAKQQACKSVSAFPL